MFYASMRQEFNPKFLYFNKAHVLLNMQQRQKLKRMVKKKLSVTNPCRESEVDILLNLLALPVMPQSIFVYGHAATGKTYTAKNILAGLNYACAYVDCIECYSPKLMFQRILDQISGGEPWWESPKCDNMMDFVTCLEERARIFQVFRDPYVIILDNCESLRSGDGTLLAGFLHLQEFSRLNLCVILIAGISWDKFYSKINCEVPVVVYFRQYTKDELLQLLLLDMETDTHVPRHLHRPFLELVLSVCSRYCCSLVELRHIARVNIRKVCSPTEQLAPDSFTVKQLWLRIKPHLESSVKELYMRSAGDVDGALAPQEGGKLAAGLQLPYFTKYMLIAAYLASYNPATSDKRMFVKGHGKERKRPPGPRKGSAIDRNLRQPDSFTSDRLLAIFYSIVEDRVGLSTALLAQISTLVKLRLLIQDTEDCLATTYRCAVNLDFVTAIGRNVDFNVLKYLYTKD